MPTPVVCRCDYCQGHRRHTVEVVRRPGVGPTTRELVCPACDSRKPWGICCPKCGDCRFRFFKTTHRPDGSTVRLKKCRHCGHRIRTRERVESLSG